jgi:hypothetical protein
MTSPFPSNSTWRITTRHRHNTEVDGGGQAAVEAHLLVAVMLTLGQCAEVDKSIVDRLLDLVDIVADQENG